MRLNSEGASRCLAQAVPDEANVEDVGDQRPSIGPKRDPLAAQRRRSLADQGRVLLTSVPPISESDTSLYRRKY